MTTTVAANHPTRIVSLSPTGHRDAVEDVMTEENLMRYYGARVAVVEGPHGRVVVPYRLHERELS